MCLITAITASTQERVGVLEVAVRMDDILPDLFSGTASNWAVLADGSGELLAGQVLVDGSGELLAGQVPVDGVPLEALAQAEDRAQYALAGTRVLVTRTWFRDLDCTYLQVTSLTDIDRAILAQSVYLLAVLLAAFALMIWAVSRLTRRILRGFYRAFDGIRAFAGGDENAVLQRPPIPPMAPCRWHWNPTRCLCSWKGRCAG